MASSTQESSIKHETHTLSRHYKVSPARVFAAWSDAEARGRWGCPSPDIVMRQDYADFSVGGCDETWCVIDGVDAFLVITHWLDIVPERRIVMTEVLSDGERQTGASLACAEFFEEDGGTRLAVTLQVAGFDNEGFEREALGGWSSALDHLAREFETETA